MEWSPESLQLVSQCFLHTLYQSAARPSPPTAPASPSPSSASFDDHIKNHLKSRWSSPSLLDPPATEHWGKLLDSIVTLVSRPEEDRAEEEPEMPDIGENVGYTASFVRLFNAGKKEEDPVKEISGSFIGKA